MAQQFRAVPKPRQRKKSNKITAVTMPYAYKKLARELGDRDGFLLAVSESLAEGLTADDIYYQMLEETQDLNVATACKMAAMYIESGMTIDD